MFDLFNLVRLHNDTPVNKYVSNLLRDRINYLIKDSKEIKPKSKFDELVLENIDYILYSNSALQDFLSNMKSQYSTEQMVDILGGDKSFDKIIDFVKSVDWKLEYEYEKSLESRRPKQIRNDTKESKEEIEKIVPEIKKNVLKYAKDKKYLPEDFDFKLVLLPYSNYSRWNSHTKTIELGPYCFECLDFDHKVRVNPSQAYVTTFHELVGHGSQQFNSEDLPMTLWLGEEIPSIIPAKMISEGIARLREEEGLEYITKNRDSLGLEEDFVKTQEIEQKTTLQRRAFNLFVSQLKEKELRDSTFDIIKYGTEITDNPRLAIQWKRNPNIESFDDSINILGHLLGIGHINSALEGIRQKLGEDKFNHNKDLINNAITRGVWTWKVYPKFLDYYLGDLK